MTEATISEALDRYFVGNCQYKLANSFIFKRDWESDFFVQKKNGYCYEFEIKISRSDFNADKKKIFKHQILKSGGFIEEVGKWENNQWFPYNKETAHSLRPNKFFYVVPDGMIDKDEIPEYAGLFYFGNQPGNYCGLNKIKDAPFIHKNKLNLDSVLCSKFYWLWINAKHEIFTLKNELDDLKSEPPKETK